MFFYVKCKFYCLGNLFIGYIISYYTFIEIFNQK